MTIGQNKPPNTKKDHTRKFGTLREYLDRCRTNMRNGKGLDGMNHERVKVVEIRDDPNRGDEKRRKHNHQHRPPTRLVAQKASIQK